MKAKPAPVKRRNNLRSARKMLTDLREFSGDFASVKITQGALAIEVTFDKTTPRASAPVERPKHRPPPQREIKPAVAMLDETPPAFDFEMS
jgi:hypothetical protein